MSGGSVVSAETIARLERASGDLSRASVAAMDRRAPWFHQLGADERSWIGVLAGRGIRTLVRWLRSPEPALSLLRVFWSAPASMLRSLTLRQTVELVQITVEVVEEHLDELAGSDDDAAALREAVLRYSRELGFTAALLYADAAESRGAWDARLESLIIDGLVRGDAESMVSPAAALGWPTQSPLRVVVGGLAADAGVEALDRIHQLASAAGASALAAVQANLVVVAVAAESDPVGLGEVLAAALDPDRPVVVGPVASRLAEAGPGAAQTVRAFAAAQAWPGAPRPVPVAELLPERALGGDRGAAEALVRQVFSPVAEAGGDLLRTLESYLAHNRSLEATARDLIVHVNTVRYRLGRITALTGLAATDPRESYVLQVAVTVGRLWLAESGPFGGFLQGNG